MSRRASDKTRARLLYGLLALSLSASALAAVIGYKAIGAIDGFNAFIDLASRAAERKSMIPEGY